MHPPLTLRAMACCHHLLLAGLGVLMLGDPSPVCAGEIAAAAVVERAVSARRRMDIMVSTTDDAGEGSLRQAILQANRRDGADTIRFDAVQGPFATPQTITLESELPELTGELTIDGYIQNRLWKPSGVMLSGAGRYCVFRVSPGARVNISSLTVADGRAIRGGGITNQGELVVTGVTFKGNVTEQNGGGIANLGGVLTVLNSTFISNQAGNAGGGIVNVGGELTVTNCTFSENTAKFGGGLFSDDTLLVRNTILANSVDGADCVATGNLDPASKHNLIEVNRGCGNPVTTADPGFQKLGRYNGPTPTLPPGGGSSAINLGDNASAVDEHGKPLRWDQRGNGDPRFVAGITDIGAFEVQALPVLVVDTVADIELRACRTAQGDCSLRGAIALANAAAGADVITFDAKVFSVPRTISLSRPLPEVTSDLTIDAGNTNGVTLRGAGAMLRAVANSKLILREITLDR